MVASLNDRIAPLTNPSGHRFTPVDVGAPCGAKMKGFPLLHLLQLMDATGPEVANTWRATLPAAARPQTERQSITAVGWLPIELYFHGVDWLARTHQGGVRGAIDIGHQSANKDIGAFFRIAMSFTSPATVMNVSGRFWKSYFDRSSLHVTNSGPNSCAAEVRDWPLRDEASLHEMAGSLVAWMEATRVTNVRMHRFELTKPGLFSLEVSWG